MILYGFIRRLMSNKRFSRRTRSPWCAAAQMSDMGARAVPTRAPARQKSDGEHADELYGDGELDLPEPRKASGAVRGGGMWC